MPNPEHLNYLEQGVDAWNQWRKLHPEIEPDISEADLSGRKLNGANLSDTDLRRTNLTRTDLRSANLIRADLRAANVLQTSFNLSNLSEANFSEAYIRQSDLSETDLKRAYFFRADLVRVDLWQADLNRADFRWAYLICTDLNKANLTYTDFRWAYLSEVNLAQADLQHANLIKANLIKSDLEHTHLKNVLLAWTHFGDIDLSVARGLKTAIHYGPSSIGIDTICRSKGGVPETMLHGAGLSDQLIVHIKSLAADASAYHGCFISYAAQDQEFAQKLHADLQNRGVRCWFDAEELKIGDSTWDSIYHAIRTQEKILLVLSENSMSSGWIENEVTAALEMENKRKTPILYPICLDWAAVDADLAWAEYINKTRNIYDFSKWQSAETYTQSFEWLLGDLQIDK